MTGHPSLRLGACPEILEWFAQKRFAHLLPPRLRARQRNSLICPAFRARTPARAEHSTVTCASRADQVGVV